MHTQAVEDYLKTIYELQSKQDKVNTTLLAKQLDIAPASVTGMVKKLAAMRLVEYERYQGVQLSPNGEKIALAVIRHHRLVESYLSDALGVPWDKVHDEAEKWEHILSEDVAERMDAALGHPTTDPHGAPIPTRDGVFEAQDSVPLTSLQAGQRAIITEVSDHDPELLRYLGTLNLYPQTEIEILAVAPFDGPFTIQQSGKACVLGREAANYILVTDVE